VNIRHGYETPKTEKLSRRYRDELFLNLHFYDVPKLPIPREDTPEFADFQRRIKTEPFQRIIDEHRPAAYFSGVMRWQSGSRRDTGFIEHKGSVLAINPILDMTQKQVDEFFLATGLPRNGDYYDPAKGEHQSLECGLHTGVYR
jgi:3'-phosphoadenosine 5'-phosphosulfate sulfotransferase (PAPS reductase)/FAD synthetase